MILNETDARFYVAASTVPGAGRGLFAKSPLGAGDRLEVIGVLVPRESISDDCTQYADHYKLRAGDHLLIPMGLGAMVNHAPMPNVEKVVEGEAVYLRALRPIAAGEELFLTYSDFAQDMFGLR